MIRRPPRSTQSRSSAASDVYKRQLEYRKGGQSNIVLGFRTFGSSHKDYYIAEVLARILGGTMSSRLFQKIREEMGAAYSIGAYQTSFANYGYLAIVGGVQNKKLKAVS